MSLRQRISGRRSPRDVVARAANTAEPVRSRGSNRFLMLVVAVVLAGTTTVGYAWAERQYERPTVFDSWQNAYGIYDCQTDSWLDPLESVENPHGIRTRGDDMIYIEPTTEAATGNNAQLALFLDTTGAELTDDMLSLPNGQTLAEQGVTCNGEEAVLQVVRFSNPVTNPEQQQVRASDLADTRFLDDQQALVIALAGRGATIELPPSANKLVARTVSPS